MNPIVRPILALALAIGAFGMAPAPTKEPDKPAPNKGQKPEENKDRPAPPQDEQAAIRKALDDYLDAFERRDLEGVLGTVAAKAPDRDTIEKMRKTFFADACDIQLTAREISGWWAEGDKVRVRLRFVMKWRVGTRQNEEDVCNDVRFVKEAGHWVIWTLKPSAAEIGLQLLAAETKEDRARLLRENADLSGSELLWGLQFWASAQLDLGRLEVGDRVIDVYAEVAEHLDSAADQARAHTLRAVLNRRRSGPRAAIDEFEAARALYLRGKDPLAAARVTLDLAGAYDDLGESSDALKCVRQAEHLIACASIFYDFCTYLNYSVGLPGAAGVPGVAGASARRLAGAWAWALTRRGEIEYRQGEYAGARTAGEKGLEFARRAGDARVEGDAHGLLGFALFAGGHPAEGLQHLETATRLSANQFPEEHASALADLGRVYMWLGRDGDAQKALVRARDTFAGLGDAVAAARVGGSLGSLYVQQGKIALALEEFEACIGTLIDKDCHLDVIVICNIYGTIFTTAGRLDDADKLLAHALWLAREHKMRDAEAMTLTTLGAVWLARGKPKDALARHEQALAAARRPIDVMSCWANIGAVHRSTGAWEKAAAAYERAVAAIEQLRVSVAVPALQRDFFARATEPYHRLAQCHIKLGRNEEAFAATERAKARTLIDMLERGRADIPGSLTPQERKEERQLRDRLERADARAQPASGGDAPSSAYVEQNEARSALEKFERDAFLKHAELRDQRARFSPAPLTELADTLFAREPDLAILSYSVEQDETLLLVLTSEPGAKRPTVRAHALPIGRQELAAKAHDLHFLCTVERGDDNSDKYKLLAADLFARLMKPAWEQLKGKKHLVLIPDGPLHTLPFAVLTDGDKKYLIEHVSLSVAPSATALVKMVQLADRRSRDPAPKLAAVVMGRPTMPAPGLSDLESTEPEAKAVAARFKVAPLLGRDASEARARLDFPDASYIHIASHGVLSPGTPMYSFIALSKDGENDGQLQARELLQMKLKARLVVLSACETGKGREQAGEGLVGLGWSLFVAGAPSAVLTLWNVSDESTAVLMEEFYKGLKPDGAARLGCITKAEALRQAQIKLLKAEKTAHPRRWAPFVLVGDWGR